MAAFPPSAVKPECTSSRNRCIGTGTASNKAGRMSPNVADPTGTVRALNRLVDLTVQHTNRVELVDGPDIMVRVVGARPGLVGAAR
ncbi:hypothetical protein GCM10010198_03800 [Nocardia seriolae]